MLTHSDLLSALVHLWHSDRVGSADLEVSITHCCNTLEREREREASYCCNALIALIFVAQH